jgi:hypothetical protein
MYYFKFQIPVNADGSRVSYSPGWHGTMPRCPQNVEVLLQNDKEGWGIARTADTFVPKEVTALKEADALALVSNTKDEAGVFKGEKLADRWLPEATIEDKPVDEPVYEGEPVATQKAIFCPVCHRFIMWLSDNITAKRITLVCPLGHKVVLNG